MDRLQDLVCAINRSRPSNRTATQRIKTYLIKIPHSHKRYTTIAQATLLCKRKKKPLHLKKGLSDADLCRTLSSVLGYQRDSLDVISDELQALLRDDRVRGLSTLFSELQHYDSRTEQAEAAMKVLKYLKVMNVIEEIGSFDDEQLRNCAQVCASLCYKSGFDLPRNLSDATLPDLALKLAIMMYGRDV